MLFFPTAHTHLCSTACQAADLAVGRVSMHIGGDEEGGGGGGGGSLGGHQGWRTITAANAVEPRRSILGPSLTRQVSRGR